MSKCPLLILMKQDAIYKDGQDLSDNIFATALDKSYALDLGMNPVKPRI